MEGYTRWSYCWQLMVNQLNQMLPHTSETGRFVWFTVLLKIIYKLKNMP